MRRSETANRRIRHVKVDTGRRAGQFGQGGTSQTVPLPNKIHGEIMRPFDKVRELPHEDMTKGDAGVLLPASFEQQGKSAARELVWQWFFPAPRLTLVEATRDVRRSPVHEPAIQRAIQAAARKAGRPKRVAPHTRRHTLATHPLQAHDDICQMQPRFGHRNVRTTRLDTLTIATAPIRSPIILSRACMSAAQSASPRACACIAAMRN